MSTEKSSRKQRKTWNVQASWGAINTSNPIREIIETMNLAENPNKKVIPLSIGDPTIFGNLKPCKEILDALQRANSSGRYYGYQTAAGMESAREAVADYHHRCTGNRVKRQDVILASGCSHAIDLCICVLARSGQNILIPRPGFPLYKTLISVYGVEYKQYDLLAEQNWSIDLRHLESLIDDNTAAIVVNNPSNPCGSVFSRNHSVQIIELAERYKIPIIADEIYDKFVFTPELYRRHRKTSSSFRSVNENHETSANEEDDSIKCCEEDGGSPALSFSDENDDDDDDDDEDKNNDNDDDFATDTKLNDNDDNNVKNNDKNNNNNNSNNNKLDNNRRLRRRRCYSHHRDHSTDSTKHSIDQNIDSESDGGRREQQLKDTDFRQQVDDGEVDLRERRGRRKGKDDTEDDRAADSYNLEDLDDDDDDIELSKFVPFRPLSSLSESVPILTCGGISKTCLIPGLRLGWIIINDPSNHFESVRVGLNRLTQRLMGPNSLVQGALSDILATVPETFYLKTMDFIFQNAKLCYERLSLVSGLQPFMPQGSMYLMIRFEGKSFPDIDGDLDFTSKLMNEESVLVLPGRCFDFPNYFRICLTVPANVMEEALDRISEFCDRHRLFPELMPIANDTKVVSSITNNKSVITCLAGVTNNKSLETNRANAEIHQQPKLINKNTSSSATNRNIKNLSDQQQAVHVNNKCK